MRAALPTVDQGRCRGARAGPGLGIQLASLSSTFHQSHVLLFGLKWAPFPNYLAVLDTFRYPGDSKPFSGEGRAKLFFSLQVLEELLSQQTTDKASFAL